MQQCLSQVVYQLGFEEYRYPNAYLVYILCFIILRETKRENLTHDYILHFYMVLPNVRVQIPLESTFLSSYVLYISIQNEPIKNWLCIAYWKHNFMNKNLWNNCIDCFEVNLELSNTFHVAGVTQD